MKWPMCRRRKPGDKPQPQPGKAKEDLERLVAQREEVHRLRRGYRQEFIANHFGQNVERLFKEGGQ